MSKPDKYELLAETARRRGFFWQSYEIYGGVGGFLDFGPLGTALRRRIIEDWRRFFVQGNGLIEISTPVIAPHRVLEASGHVEHFKDPLVECGKCTRRFRADHLLQDAAGLGAELLSLEEIDQIIREKSVLCPECGGNLGKARYFQTMFTTTIGPYSEAIGYGRPETAQGIFVNFKRLYEICRERLPQGVAQIGTVLRNEISPRQGPIRLREFTIMEFEFFFDPESKCDRLDMVASDKLRLLTEDLRLKGSSMPMEISVSKAVGDGLVVCDWMAYLMALSQRFVTELGIPRENLRFEEKLPGERAHYSRQTFDLEVLTERWGWVEAAGFAYRTDYDLSTHMKNSGVDLRVFKAYDKPVKRRVRSVIPIKSVIGPAFKDRSEEVMRKIQELDPSEVEASFREKGFYQLGPDKILQNYVEIKEAEVTETGRRFLPHVVEPSFGAERLTYLAMEYAYSAMQDRAVLRLPRRLAPVQAVVLPLMAKDGLSERAAKIHEELVANGFDCEYDDAGSIGRRYARADEIGVPMAITVDYDTLKEDTVTLRERDTWKQVRAASQRLPELLARYLSGQAMLSELGTPFEAGFD